MTVQEQIQKDLPPLPIDVLNVPKDSQALTRAGRSYHKASVVVRSATLTRLSRRHRRFNSHKLQAAQHPLARRLIQFPRCDAPPLSKRIKRVL